MTKEGNNAWYSLEKKQSGEEKWRPQPPTFMACTSVYSVGTKFVLAVRYIRTQEYILVTSFAASMKQPDQLDVRSRR